MNRIVVLGLVVAAGCSSIVDDPCASGYHFSDGTCVAAFEGPDAGSNGPGDDGGPNDAGPTRDGNVADPTGDGGGPTCELPDRLCDGVCIDVMGSDPANCGACNHVCASGICELGICVGEIPGHVVAIGHDYQSHNAAMARVLGNSIALAKPHDVGIARLAGSSTTAAHAGTSASISNGMGQVARPFHGVALPAVPGAPLVGVDVLIVDAQVGEASLAHALGAAWKPSVDNLLARGGVVIVLEGAGGVGYELADGAGLYTLVTPPVDATNTPAFVSDAGDAIAQLVVTPYLASTTSAAFPDVSGVIATPAGAVVVHTTRF